MIRLFTALCKLKLENLPDETIFRDATDSFRYHGEKCPCCGAVGQLSPYGGYSRGLTSCKDGGFAEERVQVNRFKCGSCGATHALLPDVVIPYSPYSLRFKLTVLLAYLERTTTVAAVCESFGIAVSTLYEWKKTLLHHKDLLLGVLMSRKEPARAFLSGLFVSGNLSERLRDFFWLHGISFMQNQPMPAARSRPP